MMNKKRYTKRKHQSGNVLFLILIAVALFAALSYVVSQSSRSNSGSTASEQANLIASQIMGLSASYRTGILNLTTTRGCTEATINFFSPNPEGYINNPQSPADKSCNLFDKAGAALAFQRRIRPNDVNVYSSSFSALNHFEAVGSDCAANPLDACNDLAYYVIDVSLDVCKKINESLGIFQTGYATPEVPDILFGTGFNGTYVGNSKIGNTASSSALKGHYEGCVKEAGVQSYTSDVSSTQNPYVYYTILIAR